MSDDVRTLTAQLADDPSSLAFLDLAELLRRRGQLDAALTVAANGLSRYPELADAHALRARILAERGDGDGAFDGWMNTLQLDSTHQGAHRGLGFLYYRSGDLPRALRHLEFAAERAPDDRGLESAIDRVRAAASDAARAVHEEPVAPPREDPEPRGAPPVPFSLDIDATGNGTAGTDADLFAGLEGARDGLLLLDQHGLRLGGAIRDDDGVDVSDSVAAHLAGVSREAARAARLLGLGAWQSVAVECEDGNAHLVAPTAETVLLTVRDVSVPAGRLAIVADRAAQAARRWLEGLS
jgi:predicted regulator of Ras-like GTPase activity (Roadblock/LC7/MglB family)